MRSLLYDLALHAMILATSLAFVTLLFSAAWTFGTAIDSAGEVHRVYLQRGEFRWPDFSH